MEPCLRCHEGCLRRWPLHPPQGEEIPRFPYHQSRARDQQARKDRRDQKGQGLLQPQGARQPHSSVDTSRSTTMTLRPTTPSVSTSSSPTGRRHSREKSSRPCTRKSMPLSALPPPARLPRQPSPSATSLSTPASTS